MQKDAIVGPTHVKHLPNFQQNFFYQKTSLTELHVKYRQIIITLALEPDLVASQFY